MKSLIFFHLHIMSSEVFRKKLRVSIYNLKTILVLTSVMFSFSYLGKNYSKFTLVELFIKIPHVDNFL